MSQAFYHDGFHSEKVLLVVENKYAKTFYFGNLRST